MTVVTLRPVEDSDLDALFAQSCDPVGVRMAASAPCREDDDGKKRNASWYTVERSLAALDSPEQVGRTAATRALAQIVQYRIGNGDAE